MEFRNAVFTKDFSILQHLSFLKFSSSLQTLCVELITLRKRSQRLSEHDDAHKNKELNRLC
jgi:hypothetical protein